MALEQLEIKRDVEAVAKGIGDGLVGRNCLIFISSIDSNPRRVSVTRGVNALVLVIFPLRGRHLAIVAAVEDITVVYGHHLIAGDFDCGLLHDGAAEVLNHSPVDNRAWVVSNNNGLPHAFDPPPPQGLTEALVRIKFGHEFA